jgi:hypothetical protein
MVMFTAGGTGAGKSTAIKAVPGAKSAKDTAQIVYDTNMSTYGSAVKKIDQALAAGKQVRVSMVVRDPVDALVNGALPRAERQRAQFGSGRTVPIGEHAKTHIGAVDAVPRLASKYADNPNVFFEALDNTKGKGNVTQLSVDKLGGIKYDGLEGLLRDALEKEHDMGRISEATYKGFLSGQ